jgi:hypothetical protein
MRHKLILIILAALVIVVLAGCGSSKKKAQPAGLTTNTTNTMGTTGSNGNTGSSGTDTTTISTDTTGTGTSTGISGWAMGSKNCQALIGLWGQVLSSAGSSSGSTLSASQQQQLNQLAANAPASLKADFQTVESALVTYISAVKNLHLKSGQTPSIQQLPKLEEALKAIQTPAFTAAQTRISTWETKNCG